MSFMKTLAGGAIGGLTGAAIGSSMTNKKKPTPSLATSTPSGTVINPSLLNSPSIY